MTERPWVWPFLLVPFVYVPFLALPGFGTSAVVVVGAVTALAAVAVLSAVPWPRWRALAPLVLVAWVFVTLGAVAVPSSSGTLGGDLTAGSLLGAPLVAAVYAGRESEPVPVRAGAFGIGLVWALGLLAGLRATTDLPYSGWTFANAFLSANSNQLAGLFGLATGQGYLTLPLHGIPDPVWSTLVAVSVLGFLGALLVPATAEGVPLPLAAGRGRDDPKERELPADFGFSSSQRAVYARRSRPESPSTVLPTGFGPVVAATVAVMAFLFVAAARPVPALFLGMLAVAVGLALVILFVEVPTALVRLLAGVERLRPARRAPPAGPSGVSPPTEAASVPRAPFRSLRPRGRSRRAR